jgi:protein-tyrosine phosphatase
MKVSYQMKRVLFLCTGNYYRSRFAEIVFNWHAELRGLAWRAESRGLALDNRNAGPISRHTVLSLAAQGISWAEYLRPAMAHRIIAVKEAEHRPIVEARFATWRDLVEYWHVHDIDCATPDEAIAHLEREIVQLLTTLSAVAA